MPKTSKGQQALLFPLPTFLMGVQVDGKPNFITVAGVGIANSEPMMLTVAVRPARHSYVGLVKNSTFSLNLPSKDMLKETDYCGTVSGVEVDKAAQCKFDVFYGRLNSAPLIKACPANIECRVDRMIELPSHYLVIGRVEEVHLSDACATGGDPDMRKIQPFMYVIEGAERRYYELGQILGKAYISQIDGNA